MSKLDDAQHLAAILSREWIGDGDRHVLRFDGKERGFVERLDDHWRIFLDGSYKVSNATTLTEAKVQAERLVAATAVQKLMRRKRATSNRR